MSRIETLKKQNPLLDVSIIDIIASLDPTTTYKYTPFMVNILKGELSNSPDIKRKLGETLFSDEAISLIERFEKHCSAQRIKQNDITKYKSFTEIQKAVKEGDEILKQKESEKQIIKLYDKDGYLVLIPLTFEASKIYGANTKWCITQETYWKNYQWNYRIIYIIDKNKNKKWAISRKYSDNTDVKGWDSADKEISPMIMDLPDDVLFIALKNIRKPKFEVELNVLGTNKNSIFTSDGRIVSINDASKQDVNWFNNTFKQHLNEILKKPSADNQSFDQLIEAAKKMSSDDIIREKLDNIFNTFDFK